MVSRLVGLKARLLWNGLRADRQRRIGLPLVVAALVWGAWSLAVDYRSTLVGLPAAAQGSFSLWAALGFFALWVALPVVIFPLDENLDPAQFALAPVTPPQLVLGLAAAALVAPSIVVPALTLGTNVVVWREVLPAAVVGSVLLGAVLIVSGQVFTTVMSAILRTRRGRDLTTLLIGAIGLVGFGAQQIVRRAVDRLGLEGAVRAYPLDGWAGLLPPVAAQRVITEAAAGRPLAALGSAVVAGAWVVGLAWVWHRLLAWLLTTPEDHAPRSWTAATNGLVGNGRWSPRVVMARKELRFYVRDPRQRLVWTGAVIFVGLAAAAILVGTEGIGAFRAREWLPLFTPALVLFVGLPIALNAFGWERNAASFLFVLPTPPRQLIIGKNIAAAIALFVETALLAIVLAALSGSWSMLRLVPALTVCAVGCQLAVGNIVSVLTPLRLPREGTDVFAQATEQGFLAILAQLVSFLAIGLLLVVPASVVVLTVSFGSPIPEWTANLVAIVWGLAAYGISLWLSGWILGRRIPEVVGWVQVV